MLNDDGSRCDDPAVAFVQVMLEHFIPACAAHADLGATNKPIEEE